jgi:mono/diheme cytochrome c family protein
MEAFAGKLKPAQIDDVVAYVRRLGTPAVASPEDLLPAPPARNR